MNRKLLKRLLILVLSSMWDSITAQLPFIRQTGVRQGLPQSQVSCLLEDQRGYIWSGTRGGGLARINGNQVQVFNSSTGLAGDFISDLQPLSDGSLLLTSAYAGLQVLSGNAPGPVLAYRQIREYYRGIPLNDSLFYAIHSDGVSLFHRKRGYRKQICSFPFQQEKVHAAGFLNEHWMLLAMDSGLYSLDVRPEGSMALLTRVKISALKILDRQSALLIAANGRASVFQIRNGRPNPGNWYHLPGLPLRQGEEIRQVLFGFYQNLRFVATSQNRILEPGSAETDLSRLNGMKVPAISVMLCDRNGTLRVGTQGFGMLSIPRNSATSYSEFPLLTNGRLTAVLKTTNGQILCGGPGSGLIVFSPNRKETRCLFPGTDVYGLHEMADFILVGTSNGFRVLRKRDLSEQTWHRNMGKSINFRSLADGRVFIGTAGSGLWIWEPGKVPMPCYSANSEPRFVYSILPAASGFLLASNSGIWRYRLFSGILEKLPVPDSLAGPCFSGARDLFGNYWFAGSDGLISLSGRKWSSFRVRDGLKSTLIYTLNADSMGTIWVGGGKGIDKLRVNSSGKVVNIKNIGPEEGFDGYEANIRGSFIRGKELLICTIHGLFSVPLHEQLPDAVPPKPQFTGMRATTMNHADTLLKELLFSSGRAEAVKVVPVNQDWLIFEFSAVNALRPSGLNFCYRITELDSVWSKPSDASSIRIPVPPPGEYTLEVKACYEDQQCSEPARLKFRVATHWLRSWMLALPVLLMLLLQAWYYGIFTKKPAPASLWFGKEFYRKEKSIQWITFLPALIYPLLSFLAPFLDASIQPNPALSAGMILLMALLFILSFFSEKTGIRKDLLVKILFFILLLDCISALIVFRLPAFYACLVPVLAAWSLFVFHRLQPIFLLAVFLILFSWSCIFFDPQPKFSTLDFQMLCAGFSLSFLPLFRLKQSVEARSALSSLVLNKGPVSAMLTDASGCIAFMSEALLRLSTVYAVRPTDIEEWSRILENPNDFPRLQEILKAGDGSETRWQIRDFTREIRWFSIRIFGLNSGWSVWIMEDCSKKQELEQKFGFFMANPDDLVFQADAYGKILFAAPEGFQQLGYSTDELIGKNFSLLVPETWSDSITESFQNQLQENIPMLKREIPVLSRSGDLRWFSLQTSTLITNSPSTSGSLMIRGRDISKEKAEREIIRSQQQMLAESNSMVSRIRSAYAADGPKPGQLFSGFAVWNDQKEENGGNFLWTGSKAGEPLLAMGSCPGSALPAAILSNTAMAILRELQLQEKPLSAEEILARFNRQLQIFSGNPVSAGLDQNKGFLSLALISVDVQKAELSFLSSGIQMLHFRKNPSGLFSSAGNSAGFRNDYSGFEQRIPLEPGDIFYLFTEGFVGADVSGESFENFREILKTYNELPLQKGMRKIQEVIGGSKDQIPNCPDRMLISFSV